MERPTTSENIGVIQLVRPSIRLFTVHQRLSQWQSLSNCTCCNRHSRPKTVSILCWSSCFIRDDGYNITWNRHEWTGASWTTLEYCWRNDKFSLVATPSCYSFGTRHSDAKLKWHHVVKEVSRRVPWHSPSRTMKVIGSLRSIRLSKWWILSIISIFDLEMNFKVTSGWTGSTIFRLAMVDSFRQKLTWTLPDEWDSHNWPNCFSPKK